MTLPCRLFRARAGAAPATVRVLLRCCWRGAPRIASASSDPGSLGLPRLRPIRSSPALSDIQGSTRSASKAFTRAEVPWASACARGASTGVGRVGTEAEPRRLGHPPDARPNQVSASCARVKTAQTVRAFSTARRLLAMPGEGADYAHQTKHYKDCGPGESVRRDCRMHDRNEGNLVDHVVGEPEYRANPAFAKNPVSEAE